MPKQKSHYQKPQDVNKEWILINANDQILGRVSGKIADMARGKNKVYFTPSVDCGDFIIVINANHIKVSGNKMEGKIYYRHTGYPGGLRQRTFKEQLKKDSTKLIMDAVKGMLPKTKLAAKCLKNVKVYPESTHPHQAQNPREVNPLTKETK